ncbi:hypothetical protein [Nocardioides plantarum]|uniref:Uncharacterized protein n=1 Tax=Nocardioides plantarum TaxID=29299 RepID=A0ABV5KAL2_9ACTN|nr:hypothetical protein [Nocardioides plantarum]
MTYSEAEKGEIRSDITLLYRAGRMDFPDRAADVATVTSRLSELIDNLNGRAAQLGDPDVTQHMLATCADVHNALVRTVTTLNDCAVGLVHIADDFVARDEFAREVFNGLNQGLTTGPIAQATVPNEIIPEHLLQDGDGDEYTSAPDVQSPEDELDDRNDQLDSDQDALPEPDVEVAG